MELALRATPTLLSVTLSAVEGNLPVTVPVALESFWLWKSS